MHMPDSLLNGAEQALQQSFRKILSFNGLLMSAAVLAAYRPMHALPDRRARPDVVVPVRYDPVSLPAPRAPLVLAGAWVMKADDPRFGGISSLTFERGRFLAVSDLGAVVSFDPPSAHLPKARLQDLTIGPGPFGKKWTRDAESLAGDPLGRGWWVGYEQHHSLWLYDHDFKRALAAIDLHQSGWRDNRGAEGLLPKQGTLLVIAENGRDAIEVRPHGIKRADLKVGADVADAARAPDGSDWLLLRTKSLKGLSQSIAPLLKDGAGYRAGPPWPLPKGSFDNYEGLAIAPLPNGSWRFWLVTDDGHRVMARTLLVALDLSAPPGKRKARRQAPGSKNSAVEKP
jgi:hypothetical protein